MPPSQRLLLGGEAPRVDAALARLAQADAVARLWRNDATLWSQDPAIQQTIANRLGWLRIADVMAGETARIQAVADDVRGAGFRRVVLLGMGGSSLFSEVCRNTFRPAGGIDLTVLDTTDPTAVRAASKRQPANALAAIVSSKSGGTAEISALSAYFHDFFAQHDAPAGQHLVAITDTGTALERQAFEWKARAVFAHPPQAGGDVGGRFSALTFFGLVPAAILGVDVARLLASAQAMFAACASQSRLSEQPAAQIAAVLAACVEAGRDKMTLLCAPPMASFGTWVEQLVAESLGKQGKGVVPVIGEARQAPSAYGPDRLFVELQLGSEPDTELARFVDAVAAAGHPVIRITWADRYDLGGEVAKWEVATALAGVLMAINPFDEPNVKESKDRTVALLEAYVKQGGFPRETPTCTSRAITVYATTTGVTGPGTGKAVTSLLSLLKPAEYVALLSFLPRTTVLDRAVEQLRQRLAEQTGRAVILGFGPRYLHSNGQLFKGGPDNGIFLQLTCDETEDLPIPGKPYTFGVLKFAQALGDYQALQQKGRRAARFHLGADPDAGLREIASAVADVTGARAVK